MTHGGAVFDSGRTGWFQSMYIVWNQVIACLEFAPQKGFQMHMAQWSVFVPELTS